MMGWKEEGGGNEGVLEKDLGALMERDDEGESGEKGLCSMTSNVK